MKYAPTLVLALSLTISNLGSVAAQEVHEVEIIGDRAEGRFRFDPARITVAPGDLVRFVVRSGQPHSVVFDSSGLASNSSR